jgi:hypothetical protein
MQLQIDVSISDYPSGGNFRLSDSTRVENADFLTMSGILAKFHDLLAEIKKANGE